MQPARYLILAVLLPLACSQNESAFDDEATGNMSSALLAYGTRLWPMKDGAATVRVCWRPLNLGDQKFAGPKYTPDLDEVMIERRQWIQEAVEQEWNAKTVLKFVGWKPCGSEPADVEIDPISSAVTVDGCGKGQSCSDEFGNHTRGKSVHINILFGDETISMVRYQRAGETEQKTVPLWTPALCWSEAITAIQNPTTANENAFVAEWKRCLQQNALHEFGHVAGFAHEWYRTDDPAKQKACMDEYGIKELSPSVYGTADTPLGAFDSESIMSYCRQEKAATLTKEDIEETNNVYRKLAPQLASEKSDAGAGASANGQDVSSESTTPKKRSRAKTTTDTESVGGCNG